MRHGVVQSVLGSAVVSILAVTSAHAAVWTVDAGQGDDSQCVSPTYLCETIGAAVAGAISGDTINVLAGTYSENVPIAKQLFMNGAKANVDACGRSATNESEVTGTGDLFTFFTGSAGTVINGFTFSGATRQIISDTGPINNVQLRNNRHVGFTSSAVFLDDSGADITVDQNLVDGSSQTATGAVFHLDASDAFHGFHFTNNCMTDGATCFIVDGNRNVSNLAPATRNPLFDGNSFESCGIGMNVGSRALDFATVSNNLFRGNDFDGFAGGPRNTTITENSFRDNGRAGLRFTVFGSPDTTRGCATTAVTQNCFTGNGFNVIPPATDPAAILYASGANILTCTFTDNNIEGNFLGAKNLTAIPITGTSNWWGAADGPGLPDGPGTGDGVDFAPGLITFAPFLPVESPTAVDCTPPAIPMVRTMGLVVLFALLSAAGLFVLRRRANA